MEDVLYIAFTCQKPKVLFPRIGLKNPMGAFKVNVNNWGYGFRRQRTKHPYGYLIAEEDAVAIKMMGSEEAPFTALMKIEGDNLKAFKDFADGKTDDWVGNQRSRTFIKERLVDWWHK